MRVSLYWAEVLLIMLSFSSAWAGECKFSYRLINPQIESMVENFEYDWTSRSVSYKSCLEAAIHHQAEVIREKDSFMEIESLTVSFGQFGQTETVRLSIDAIKKF